MFNFIRNHIVCKTILAIAACITIVSASSASLFFFSYKHKLLSDYNVEVQNIRQIIEGSYAVHLWNIEPASIKSLNETVLSAGQYLAINIYDMQMDGSLSLNTSTHKISHDGKISFNHTHEPAMLENQYISVSTGYIDHQDEIIGKYEIYHTSEHVYEYLKRIIYNILAIFLAVTIGVTVILLILLNKFVIHKLLSLVDFAKSMANAKKYDSRVSIPGNDEISELAISINEMLEQIELKDYQKDLASRKLSQSESYLKSVFDACPDAIFISETENGVIIDVNNSASLIFERKREDLVGMDLGVISSGEPSYSVEDAYDWLTRTREKGPQRFEWLSRKSDGSFFWTEIDARCARIRDRNCFIILARDITQRKQTEETIRERDRQLRTISDNLPGGFVYQLLMEGDQRRFTYISAGIEALMDISARDVMNNSDIFYSMIQEEDRGKLHNEAQSALTDMSRFHVDLRYRSISGLVRWLMLTSAPRPLSDDKIIWDGIAIDVTAQKEAETEREKLQVQLLQAQKMEAVGTLAGGVAHDFNNLLQAMSGNIQLLLMDKSSDHPDAHRLKTVENSIERAAQLIRQLLIFSRKAEVKREVVNLNHLAEESAHVLQRTIPRMIHLDLRLAPDIWPIEANPVQVEQVLLNLGNNAAHAMPGGGRLTIETSNTLLDDEFVKTHVDAQPGPHVLLTVTDTGQGMDKETLKHIFDPFFTTKNVGQGTGLGLTTVYGIVTGHGGSVYCYSEPGMGTTFRLYWPAEPGLETGAKKQKNGDLEIHEGSETILVVDDEQDILNVTTEALESFGYSVLTANSGEDALSLYAQRKSEIDMIIMDIGMPGMGGRKCLLELVRLYPGIRILIASGYANEELARAVEKDGAAGFISKPFHITELLSRVREVIEKKSE